MRILSALTCLATLGLACIIGVLTLLPSADLPRVGGGDKLHHLLAFGALAFPTAFLRPRWIVGMVLALVAYGAAIELIQPLVGRSREMDDFVADCLGILLGTGIGFGAHLLLLRPMLRTRVQPAE